MSLSLNGFRKISTEKLMRITFQGLLLLIFLLLTGCFSEDSEQYLADLQSENITVRENGAFNLGKLKEKKAAPALVQLLASEHSKNVKLIIIDALAEINDEGSIEALIATLKETDSDILIRTIEALGKIGSPKATQALIELLNNEDLLIKLTTIRALGNIKDQQSIAALTDLIGDSSKYVEYNAIQALKKIGDEK